ncbi:MAG: acetylxylan esterase [Chitinophagaceae bacterium]|nr:acetylxylan esterase [Chitinophagaceae bacterium]
MFRILFLFFLFFYPAYLLFAGNKRVPEIGVSGEPIRFEILASQKNGQYSLSHPVIYQLFISNKSKVNQEGILKYEVTSNDRDVVTKSFDVKINAGNSLKSNIVIPVEFTGNYEVNFHLEITNFSGNIKESFVYKGDKGTMDMEQDLAILRKNKTVNTKKNDNPDKEQDNGFTVTSTITNRHSNLSRNNGLDRNTATENIEDLPPVKTVAVFNEQEEGEVVTTVKPYAEDGIYTRGNKIMYDVSFKNTYSIAQEGDLSYQILNDRGTVVYQHKTNLKLKRKGSESMTLKLPYPAEAGIYKMRLCLNLSSYDDTTFYAFGYNIADIKTPYHKPPDFDAFWAATLEELAAIDPEYKISESDEYSNSDFDVYRVDMMSYESIPIYGWLTIPKIKGKYPLIVGYGAYLRTIYPEYYRNYACFMLNVRGVDPVVMEKINPEKKQFFVLGIESKETYVYRGIYMDCIRAMDFLVTYAKRFNFDMDRVAVYGGSQGGSLALVTAALLKKRINTVSADSPVYCDFYNTLEIIEKEKKPCFILEDIRNLPIYHPAYTRENVLQTLSYFEVQNFMPSIECSVLIGTGLMDMIAPPTTIIAAFNKMKSSVISKSEMYTYPTLTHEVPNKHYLIRGNWFDEQLTPKRLKLGASLFNSSKY